MSDRVAFDEHGVVGAAHGRKWMIERHHCGVHAHADLAVDLFGDREQLHHIAELVGGGDVVGS